MILASEAYLLPLVGATIKARTESDGRRIIEVEASSEAVDMEGDVVLQSALLNSSASFIRSGHIDIDHLSEIGHRIGIANPTSYIIGRPTEVNDIGDKRTSVVAEIMRAKDGRVNPDGNRYDAFWKSLESDPPVQWSASIYGFPSDIEDCTGKSCETGATRYVIRSLDWRSLAVTKNPVNTSLRGYAKIVTAKAAIDFLGKDYMTAPFGFGATQPGGPDVGFPGQGAMGCGASMPSCMDHAWGSYQRMRKTCPHMKQGNSLVTFRDHFTKCCGGSPEVADIFSHALMYAVLRDKKTKHH